MKLYLSLGANIGNRRAAIDEALVRLERRVGPLLRRSACYETRPEGFVSDHDFLNAAALFSTQLGPMEVLDATEAVERELGRTHKSDGRGYADRTIDIDLIGLGSICISTPRLTLPHPRWAERRFVLEPLAEIAPDERLLPDDEATVAERLARLNRLAVARIGQATEADAQAVGRLLAALRGERAKAETDAPTPTASSLQALLDSPNTHLYMGRDEHGSPVAMATLCLAASPTGLKAWVEDVAVAADCRRRGYARALLSHIEAEARRLGAKSLNLTSRPERTAANALYRKAGFALRATNVYRKRLDAD